ncbi:MAG TPA: GFA family protein [Caulobacteraceae bacterium]|nr:GFA family protein [Caulobacteraceae bacterium]
MIRTLSCHCGAVRIETNAELGVVTECNCSTCARHGFLHWKIRPDEARLLTTRTGVAAYWWRDFVGGHHFCKTCGTPICRTGPGYFSVNARCLDDVDVFTLDVTRYDGRREMPGGETPPLDETRQRG